MEPYIRKILHLFLRDDSSLAHLEPASWPMWLKGSRWKPDFVLSGNAKALIAVQIALSGNIPHILYREVVAPLLTAHKKLKVVVCLPRTLFDQSQDTGRFCQKLGIEVRLTGFGLGLEAVPPPPLVTPPTRPLPSGVGQFPQPNPFWTASRGLTGLSFLIV
jgi:hypothetical protein